MRVHESGALDGRRHPSGLTQAPLPLHIPSSSVNTGATRFEEVCQHGELCLPRGKPWTEQRDAYRRMVGKGDRMTVTGDAKPARKARKRADGEDSIRWNKARRLFVARIMVGYRSDGKPDVREVKSKH